MGFRRQKYLGGGGGGGGGAKEKKKGVEVEQPGTSCTVYGEMGEVGRGRNNIAK